MGKWSAFWRLAGFERGIVLEAAATLVATWVGLRLAGFRRWNFLLSRLASPRVATASPQLSIVPSARIIARMESAAARNVFFHPNCLERSMVLYWLLRSRGIPVELRVGAQKKAEQFEAHAWVECDGIALNEDEDVHLHFVPFDGPVAPMETVSH